MQQDSAKHARGKDVGLLQGCCRAVAGLLQGCCRT